MKDKTFKTPNLSSLLRANKEEIIPYLEKICTKKGDKFWFRQSKIENAVTLVCHIDTFIGDTDSVWDSKSFSFVKSPIRRRIFFDREQQVFVGPDGLGADDRAGVFGILRVYSELPPELKPNLLFCDEEEKGGHGAKEAAKVLRELKDSTFLVELDRRGRKDCVFYNDEPKEFIDYIESFGFKKTMGSFSDVSTLGREFDLCSTNLSVGYYDEHTKHETLYCEILNETIQKTIALVKSGMESKKVWPIPKALPAKVYKSSYWDEDDYGGRWLQGYFKYQGGKKTKKYTDEELARYPYLKEMCVYEEDIHRLNGYQ